MDVGCLVDSVEPIPHEISATNFSGRSESTETLFTLVKGTNTFTVLILIINETRTQSSLSRVADSDSYPICSLE